MEMVQHIDRTSPSFNTGTRSASLFAMARDFRPKEKKMGGKGGAGGGRAGADAGGRQTPAHQRRTTSNQQPLGKPQNHQGGASKPYSNADKGRTTRRESRQEEVEDDSETEEQLREAIEALGGDEDDLQLISAAGMNGKAAGGDEDGEDLDDELKAFMKGINLPTDEVKNAAREAASTSKPAEPAATAQNKQKQKEQQKEQQQKEVVDVKPRNEQKGKGEQKEKAEQEKKQREQKAKESRKQAAEEERKKAEDNRVRAAKVDEIAQKSASTKKLSAKDAAAQLLLTPTPLWMGVELDSLQETSAPSTSSPSLSHDVVVALLARGNHILDSENTRYHELLNSGSPSLTAILGGLTPSDAKFVSSLLGDTTSVSGSGRGGGTLSDRIAAHALLLGSSAFHNLRSLDALVGMCSKKSREESGRATRALADWFAGSGLGSGINARKLRYFRDQPELAATAAAPAESRGRQQRLAVFAFEDRLKKTYFTFLQTLEQQSHDTLAFVRQQAVNQTFILLREKSEQEQNLLRLLVNKLGDGERSVASKATNCLLELLNVHPNMKTVVSREVGELIRRPASKSDKLSTKRHANHARYYGVLTLNQIMLTRQDVQVANSLVQLYFELFQEALNLDASAASDGEEGDESTKAQAAKKDRWRDQKGKGKGKKGGKGGAGSEDKAVQDVESKATAAILTGVRRAFPFAQLETDVFDKHINTLFRITHSSSFNIAVQALQLIYIVATSATATSSNLLDRFHSTLYSSLLDSRLASTSKTAMYLNLCYKAMRDDIDNDRRAAEVKRLVQILSHMDVEFVCGALFLVGELIRAHPRLRGMLADAEDDDEEVIVNPPDEEDRDEEARVKQPAALANGISSAYSRYDPSKRDPRFAKARSTCLWELTALLDHFHPTVRLLTSQVISGEALTSTPDLTLHSLSHFLDKFVYRNAKKGSAQKGASGMQPAIAAAGGGEDGVRKVKGWAGAGEEVNTEKFWKRKAQDVPVDSLFFHHYFNLKQGKDAKSGKGAAAQKAKKQAGSDEEESDVDEEDAGDDESLGSDEVDAALDKADKDEGDEGSVDSDDSDEKEIWAAMKKSMPAEEGDEDLMEDSDGDEDDEDLAQYDYSDSEEDDEAEEEEGKQAGGVKDLEDSEDDGDGIFDEDEDDLLPFAEFGSDDGSEGDSTEGASAAAAGTTTAGKKRSRGENDDGDAADDKKPKTKSQERRAERKKRKAMSTFASAEDYAHLLGGDDDDEGDLGDE
ncbi:unnamed protein product [Jaminaea pallidilutea]